MSRPVSASPPPSSMVMKYLGHEAWQHHAELEEVKRQVGVDHEHFDCWIYKFLENKKFDVDETVAKLRRRRDMEQEHMRNYVIDPPMLESMRAGVMQVLGDDKEGRVTLYVVTRRDFPTKAKSEMRKQNGDMWMAYACRLRKNDPRCRVTLLVNQRDASLWSNTNLSDQTNVAIRISKFFPNIFDRVYLVGMGSMLASAAKAVIKTMPRMISDKVHILTDGDVKGGKLLENFDAAMLPVELGGTNDCDNEPSWRKFSDTVEDYFHRLQPALQAGKGVKEWELEQILEERRLEEEEAARLAEQPSLDTTLTDVRRSQLRLCMSLPDPSSGDHALSTSSLVPSHADDDGSDEMFSCASTAPDSAVSDDNRLYVMHRAAFDAAPATTTAPYPADFAALDLDDIAVSVRDREAAMWNAMLRIQRHEAVLREAFTGDCERLQETMALQFVESMVLLDADVAADDLEDAAGVPTGAETQAAHLALQFPVILRGVMRALLLVVSGAMAAFLLLGMFLLQLVAGSLITVMYLAIFVAPFHLYPVGVLILLLCYQSAAIGSRGFDLVRSALKGQVFRPLRRFGDRGAWVQFAFYTVATVAVFAALVAGVSMEEQSEGVRVGSAVGVGFGVFLLSVFHLGFPLGLRFDGEEPDDSVNAKLSLYLFLNVTERDTEAIGWTCNALSAALVGLPTVVAFVFGILYMVNTTFAFFAVALVATFGAVLVANHFVSDDHTNIMSNLQRAIVWAVGSFWLMFIFIVGAFNFEGSWGVAVGVTAAAVVLFGLLVGVTHLLPQPSWLHLMALRAAYGVLAVVAIAGIALVFLIHWAPGIFGAAMLLHAVACYIRARSVHALGVATALLTAMFCVLFAAVYARFDPPPLYEAAVSRNASVAEDTLPLCLQRWAVPGQTYGLGGPGDGQGVSANELATIMLAGQAKSLDEARVSLRVLLPEYHVTHEVTFADGDVRLRYVAGPGNLTVLVPWSTTETSAIGAWVEAVALEPYHYLLPPDVMAIVVAFSGFAADFLGLLHLDLIDDLVAQVRALRLQTSLTAPPAVDSSSTSSAASETPLPLQPRVVLAGYGVMGGVMSIVGSKLLVPTVTFGAPGLLMSRRKFGISRADYETVVTSVLAPRAGISGVDRHGSTEQRLRCPTDRCNEPEFYACYLRSQCKAISNGSFTTYARCDGLLS